MNYSGMFIATQLFFWEICDMGYSQLVWISVFRSQNIG